MSVAEKKHGGSRVGAGRKPGKEATVIIRVPVSVAELIKQGNLNNVTKSKEEPEQTWTFSYDDLQEQARLIERLQQENEHLKADLQLKTKELMVLQRGDVKTGLKSNFDVENMDKIALYHALANYMRQKQSKPLHCDCKTVKGLPCKKPYEPENSLDVMFSVDLCSTHKI